MSEIKVTAGALLHDIGKLVQRAGGVSSKYTGNHSKIGFEYLIDMKITDKDILDCVKLHHKTQLKNATNPGELSHIVYIADNIASANDRRTHDEDEKGWDKKAPLQSIFNLLTEKTSTHYLPPTMLGTGDQIPFPEVYPSSFDEFFYSKILQEFTDNIKNFEMSPAYINSLLELAEATLSFVPSSTDKSQVADISLYDHMKLTAAVATCIYAYLKESGEPAGKLSQNEQQFYAENFAMLYSADISGIQNFIYTIHSEGALKSLRSRSFYLELYMENLTDEIIEALSLTRANLLYSGGGHIYMLLPNTEEALAKTRSIIANANAWLLQNFKNALYIADGYCLCSANDMQNLSPIFKTAGSMISKKKLNRYTVQALKSLNNTHATGTECKICKAVSEAGEKCELCDALISISGKILNKYDNEDNTFFVIHESHRENSVPIASGLFASAVKEGELKKILKAELPIVRYYGKNAFFTGKYLSTKLWVGDYCKDIEMSNYARNYDREQGIKRLGVLRMDVDGLGTAFTEGFSAEGGKYNTLSRIASFSRMISIFFKHYINFILLEKRHDITIVYSGGDDMFLIGSWDDTLEAAIDIADYFARYTQSKLTLSAGLGIYPAKYPIHVMAHEVGELESHAKCKDGKNSITLFTDEFRFTWQELKYVMEEKLPALDKFFEETVEKGNAFLYQILNFANEIEVEHTEGKAKISLARFAYLMAKAEVNNTKFAKQMYNWLQDPEQRRQLKAAIHLYVYSKRKAGVKHEQ